MKILMVCLGNICRSPLAEGILRDKITQNQLDWKVDSAGTSAWHAGENPDPRAIAIARQYGLDISGQTARQFSPYDFELFDRIYTMDRENYENVLSLANAENEKERVQMILELLHPGQQLSVPDPYWDDDGFDKVFRMLNEACEQLIQKELSRQPS